MKITASNLSAAQRARKGERGFLVIAMLVILALMLIYVAATMRSLTHLRQDLKLVEQKQVQRLQTPVPTATHAYAPAIAP